MGSEMCIRDRCKSSTVASGDCGAANVVKTSELVARSFFQLQISLLEQPVPVVSRTKSIKAS